MPATLIVGATGNTGRSVTTTLSALTNQPILALTRDTNTPTAQHLATLANVQVLQQNWTEITAAWLRSHSITRVFIAPHNGISAFPDESTFLVNARNAGVEYLVRISTTAPNVRPDTDVYYARTHWAIESLLSSPEFDALQWTSLQANVFIPFYLAPAVEYIKRFRETGKQDASTPLRLMASEDAPVGIIDPDEVGVFAARLLATEDPSVHNKAKYVLNGPADITGRQIVELVEGYIGAAVEHVSFKDMSFVEALLDPRHSRNVLSSIRYAAVTAWEGKCRAETTSKEVLEIAAPRRTAAEVLGEMVREESI
ncbi:NAD(P)-binding protein [Aspergillus aurantiobrunneus]